MEITVSKISKTYGKQKALTDVSAILEPGTITGLIGPNGAGKTTLLKIVTTILKPSDGAILLNGKNVIRHPEQIRSRIGYLPQKVAVYPNLTAREHLQYVAAIKKIRSDDARRQVSDFLEALHLSDSADIRLSGFSGGMLQKVGLISAMLGEPDILIVDEPTAGLDPRERITVRNLLSAYSREHIVVLSTHIISDIEAVSSRLLLLKSGILIYDGHPEELIQKAQNHVWEYVIDSADMEDDNKDFSRIIQQNSGIRVHKISCDSPCRNAVAVEPSLEEAWLYAMEEGERA